MTYHSLNPRPPQDRAQATPGQSERKERPFFEPPDARGTAFATALGDEPMPGIPTTGFAGRASGADMPRRHGVNFNPPARVDVVNRETFKTSRLLEFCSQKELVAQTGHEVAEWPLVVIKELADNGLDIAEEIGVAPELAITVSTDTGEIVVTAGVQALRPGEKVRLLGAAS